MKTLDELALKHGTDKSSRKHHYTRLYETYFEQLRDEPLTVLEIGAAYGYSLKMWKEYFSKSKIVSIDIQDSTELNEDRIVVEQGAQGDLAFLKKLNHSHGPFDIIIDDGSHVNVDMKASFDFLFPLLKPGGLYIVEDLHMCYWGKTHGAGEPVFIDRLKELIDMVNSSGKSGTGNNALDATDHYHLTNNTQLSWWENAIEFIHLYRSIVFIRKYPALKQGSTYMVDIPHLFFRMRRKIHFVWKKLRMPKWGKKPTFA